MPTVRRARLEDAAAIARIHVDSWQAAYLGLMPAAVLNQLSVERRRASWEAILGSGRGTAGSRTWVTEVAGRVVGFVSAGPSRDADDAGKPVGEVYSLYLAPSAWGHGLGADLMQTAEDDLAGQRFKIATLWVLESNPRARRFYELSGYILDGGRKQEPVGDTVLQEVRYRKTL